MSGKRANIFGQGKPESPYEDRDGPPDVPQRATAAQLATRKIKTAKVRRPAGGASTPTQSINFAAPQTSGFGFGASAPAVGGSNSNGLFGTTSGGMFGGGTSTTNSFPPAQSAAPSNSFVSSSFPAFGGAGSTFNPQPPSSTDFNFAGAGTTPNIFSSLNGASAMNGNANGNGSANGQSTPFGGSNSIFSSQAPSTAFGQNNTTSTTSGGLFGTSSSAPSTGMFGTSGATSMATSTPATTTAPFTFGGASTTAQNSSTAPATQNTLFGGFGNNTAQQEPPKSSLFSMGTTSQGIGATTTTAPSTAGLFSFGSGSSTQQSSAVTTTAPSSTMFGATSATSAPPSSMFGASNATTTPTSMFGATSATTAAPSSSMFGTSTATTTPPSSTMFGASSATSSAPTTGMFGNASTANNAPTPAPFSFGQPTSQTQEQKPSAPGNPFAAIKAPEETNTPKPSLFSSIKAPETSSSAATEPPKPNLFSSLAKPTPAPAPAASTSGFSLFSAPQNKDSGAEKTSGAVKSSASDTGKPSLFTGGFSTPQPAKTTQTEKAQPGLFSAVQPKTSTGLFSQTFQPESHNSSNTFKPASTFSAFNSSSAPSTESTQNNATQPAVNPFISSSSSTDRPSLFTQQKEQAPASSPAAMSTLTSAASSTETAKGPELPKIPKAHVPKEWNSAVASTNQKMDNSYTLVVNLTAQLQQLNENYRAKLVNLPSAADWSALSLWHNQHSSAIKTKIDAAKKERAAAKGITGNESSLSTKRKVNEQSPENGDATPTKRVRPANTTSTNASQPSVPAPKFNPPATATSNLFAKAINNKPSAETSNLAASESSKPAAAAATGFQPTFSSNGATTSQSPFSSGGFKPTTSASTSSTGGFKPTVTGSSGGFASQFAASAKTLEQLAAERKKKAMDEDYDSDEETKAEWSARYDKQEAERIAKEKAAAALAPTFSLSKPVSGASTPGLFTPRPASPALSTGAQSVFDAPSPAPTPSANIFGHLSSGPSSNNQEESEEEEDAPSRNDQPVGSVEPTTPPKRKFGESETEADESLDETKVTKQSTGSKRSLMSRMTRGDGDGSESEKENSNTGSIFGQTNGTQTPANKPFSFFDFDAAGAKTAPPKSDTFAGDQTFKPGTPIKFGESAATEKKAPPTFQFQAASTSTTPSKPPPVNLFNFGTNNTSFLAPNPGLSGLNSAPSSVFSSRAATPLSEAETSAASAAEEDEEGGKQEQVDLSKLTAAELEANEVVFETEQALAKHQVDRGDGTKAWENFARGPLYLLKDKVTGKCFIRIRIPSGQTPLNYSILPALKSSVTGSSGKMVQATMPKKEGGFTQFFISLKTPEIAKELSEKYNASLPS